MNDIRVCSIQTYEKQISHYYYYQIVIHQVCDVTKKMAFFELKSSLKHYDLVNKSNLQMNL